MMHGDMRCRACGWWPPLVRVRNEKTEQASDRWRWRQLVEHISAQAHVEEEDGVMGPHARLEEDLHAIRETR